MPPFRRRRARVFDGPPIESYYPTEQDIRRVIEVWGKEISLTKLQAELMPTAHEHNFVFVDWRAMKTTVWEMVRTGELVEMPEPVHYHNYVTRELWDDPIWRAGWYARRLLVNSHLKGRGNEERTTFRVNMPKDKDF